MNKILRDILFFTAGAAVSFGVTYFVMKKHEEERVEAEVEDVREAYLRGLANMASENAVEATVEPSDDISDNVTIDIEAANKARQIASENAKRKVDLISYSNIIHKQNYNVFTNPQTDVDTGDDNNDEDDTDEYVEEVDESPPKEGVIEEPYIISQFEFINGERFFDKTTLNYYDDGIVEEDLTEEIINHPEDVIGTAFVEHFGDFEDDVVFVRNEKLSTDYEIVRQYRNFAEIPAKFK